MGSSCSSANATLSPSDLSHSDRCGSAHKHHNRQHRCDAVSQLTARPSSATEAAEFDDPCAIPFDLSFVLPHDGSETSGTRTASTATAHNNAITPLRGNIVPQTPPAVSARAQHQFDLLVNKIVSGRSKRPEQSPRHVE